MLTFFDIETSGLSAHTDGLLQFAALQCDDMMNPVRAVSHYVYEPDRKWSAEAEAVHGLSRDYMATVAEPLDEVVPSLYAMLQYGSLVGYNNISFDTPFISHWLLRQGCPAIQVVQQYDVMKMWEQELGHRPKLQTLRENLGMPVEAVQMVTNVLFNSKNPRPHDACYDVVVTYLCYKEIKRRHDIKRKAAPPPPAIIDVDM